MMLGSTISKTFGDAVNCIVPDEGEIDEGRIRKYLTEEASGTLEENNAKPVSHPI
jgi:hypothetical protein